MHRVAIFSHDSYGLGHLRRSVLIAEATVARRQDLDCLVVTGSPRALAFKLPDRVDAIKIPSITKSSGGDYAARKLLRGRGDVLAIRSAVTAQALEAYEADVVLVDHSPTGAGGELLPVLERLGALRRPPRLILGLRDIVDRAESVERQWRDNRGWEALRYFDEVLVYGDSTIRTTAEELGLAERLSIPVTTTGYVAPRMPERGDGEPFLLVTAGGGGDGHRLIRRVLEVVESFDVGVPVRIVTGPLLSKARQAEFITRTDRLENVTLVDFTTELRSWISSATAMVSMAGYNTTVEALAAGTPTLLVPRSDFRDEQRLRAERVSAVADHVGSVDGPDLLTADTLAALLRHQRGSPSSIDLGGAPRAARRLAGLADAGIHSGGSQALETAR